MIFFESWLISINVSNKERTLDNSNFIKFGTIISNKNDVFS